MEADRHGGNLTSLAAQSGRPAREILDFSANINPLGVPEWFRAAISSATRSIVHYPDPDSSSLVKAISEHSGVPEKEILVGNGSTEILYHLPRALKATRAVIPVPAYADYAAAAKLAGMPVEKIPLREESGFSLDLSVLQDKLAGLELVFIGQPNNPTGMICPTDDLRAAMDRNPSTIFVIDEAFADFVPGIDRLYRNRPPNAVVLCSQTKFFAIPGLRLGWAFLDAELRARMRGIIPPWSVNTYAQAVGEMALRDGKFAEETREYVREQRVRLTEKLRSIPGLTVYPGQANFLLLRIDRKDFDAPGLARELLKGGIAVRVCGNFDGLDGRFFRVAVRTSGENAALCSAIRECFGLSRRAGRKRKPAVMFQGTTSNAGKSVLTAALCRALLQDGYRVAPFKAQNMSLNSFVTREGGEMGRAQVVQAQACRLEPEVRMNPVLLKPNSDTGAQVIVRGKPVGNMDVEQYIQYKPRAFEAAQEAFDSLAEEFDVMVLEGAGSPAEVNLREHDFVNMRMARYAGAPVLLVGDIDRGGVFASFVGTLEVMAEWERALVCGLIINRFRGEESLLRPAIDYTLRHTGVPTLGVLPYLHDLGLPEEDSVSFKSRPNPEGPSPAGAVEVALIDLPHISNFTDFDALRLEPDVRLRVVREARDLDTPDAVILPGSKNVIGDLAYLEQKGLTGKILGLARTGRTELVGICGGLQILGREVSDPYGIESGGETVRGLGLLRVSTCMAREKTLKQVSATHLESRLPVKGYEIHHGRSSGEGLKPMVLRQDGEVIGGESADGMCWGTYLHGIFDADGFRRWFIDRLRLRRELPPVERVLATYDLEEAFDRLAGVLRKSLPMREIYRLMGLH